jgi:acetyl esterase
VLQLVEDRNVPPAYGLTPAAARTRFRGLANMLTTTAVADVQNFEVPGPDGGIPIRAYVPEGEGPFPVLVYYHGGGWVVGDVDTHESLTTALCDRAGVVVLSVDYRLAPEHPFPAAVEDAYAAVEWASRFAGDVGGDPDRLAVGGDSAGGNLAAAVSLMAADRDGPAIDHQLLVYPAVASPELHSFESYDANAEGYFLEWESLQYYYGHYVQSPAHHRNEYLAPLLARDLSGLPSATVVTAEFDPLRDEGIEYADRLAEAGVTVQRRDYEGMIHGFVQLKDMIDRGDDATDFLAAELADALDAA